MMEYKNGSMHHLLNRVAFGKKVRVDFKGGSHKVGKLVFADEGCLALEMSFEGCSTDDRTMDTVVIPMNVIKLVRF